MKKILFAAAALMTLGFANAEIKDDLAKCHDRAATLQKLCDGYQACDNEKIDGYANSIKDASKYTVTNSEQLENYYKRQIGEIANDTIQKPTLEEWQALKDSIAGESTKIQIAADKAVAAGEEIGAMTEKATKEKNPMKIAKQLKATKTATAVFQFGKDATPVLLEESAAQLKIVGEIIKSLPASIAQ